MQHLITFYDEGENPYELKKPIPSKVKMKLDEFVRQAVDCYGSHIREIILFGSYARGDYRFGSDVDILVVTDYSEDEVRNNGDNLSEIAFNVSYEYDVGEREDEYIVVNPLMYGQDYFDRREQGTDPFFDNVREEGIWLYEK